MVLVQIVRPSVRAVRLVWTTQLVPPAVPATIYLVTPVPPVPRLSPAVRLVLPLPLVTPARQVTFSEPAPVLLPAPIPTVKLILLQIFVLPPVAVQASSQILVLVLLARPRSPAVVSVVILPPVRLVRVVINQAVMSVSRPAISLNAPVIQFQMFARLVRVDIPSRAIPVL